MITTLITTYVQNGQHYMASAQGSRVCYWDEGARYWRVSSLTNYKSFETGHYIGPDDADAALWVYSGRVA